MGSRYTHITPRVTSFKKKTMGISATQEGEKVEEEDAGNKRRLKASVEENGRSKESDPMTT